VTALVDPHAAIKVSVRPGQASFVELPVVNAR
jgi:hypothetical protein